MVVGKGKGKVAVVAGVPSKSTKQKGKEVPYDLLPRMFAYFDNIHRLQALCLASSGCLASRFIHRTRGLATNHENCLSPGPNVLPYLVTIQLAGALEFSQARSL